MKLSSKLQLGAMVVTYFRELRFRLMLKWQQVPNLDDVSLSPLAFLISIISMVKFCHLESNILQEYHVAQTFAHTFLIWGTRHIVGVMIQCQTSTSSDPVVPLFDTTACAMLCMQVTVFNKEVHV